MSRTMRLALVLFTVIVLCLLPGKPDAQAANLSGSRPWMAEHVVISSTTDWVVYNAPTWTRSCVVKNEHASGTLYLGRYDETGTFNSTNDEYVSIGPGGSLTFPVAPPGAAADATHLQIPLASSTASLPVGFLCVESGS